MTMSEKVAAAVAKKKSKLTGNTPVIKVAKTEALKANADSGRI